MSASTAKSRSSVTDERALLRGKAGMQVMLRVKSAAGEMRDVLVTPIQRRRRGPNLRYAEWEYTRRLKVEADSEGEIGYVHLRAMGSEDIDQWARDYYPVFNRQGLIIDVRHNHGGNIDSWLLGKAAAPGLVLLAAARRRSGLEHAIRLPRPHRRAVRSGNRLRRRSFRGGLSTLQAGQADRRAHLGRRDLVERQ